MTVDQELRTARVRLGRAGVDDAAIEAEVLLAHVLGLSRSQLYVVLNGEISTAQMSRFDQLLERRLAGEPTAYITGHREFYGLDLDVDRRVLIPRPETELLVDKALELGKRGARVFCDIGTGSGCIAISVAANLPEADVYATDISRDALEVASLNCRKHAVEGRVALLQGDLTEPLPRPVDVIIANLPYVRQCELALVNTQPYEPSLALDGGEDGLARIRKLCSLAASKVNPGGSILLEIGQGQEEEATSALKRHFPAATVEVLLDLAGIPRVVAAETPLEQ